MDSKFNQFAEAANRRMERLMPVLTPLGMVLGFFLSGVFIHLRPFVPWLFGLITLSGALKLRVAEFGRTIRDPIPILVFLIATHVVMPLIATFAASGVFSGSSDVISGYTLLFSGPTAISGFIWTAMFLGDKALCLTLIILDTLLAPLMVPGTVSLLMGAKVTMDMSGIAVSLSLMVVVPTIIGVTLNEISRGKIPVLICPVLNPISKIFLIVVIAANASPVAKLIRLDDLMIWKIAALCIALSAFGFVISKLAAAAIRCNTEKTVTLFFCGGLRNISAVTTIAVTFFPEAAAMPALLGIVFQQTISAVMGKLMLRKKAR